MPPNKIVVMGASAGGVEAVATAIGGLPSDLGAVVLVVIHTGAAENNLAPVLGRNAALPVQPAADNARLQPGNVFVALSDRHLIVEDGTMRVVNGPRQHGFRPAIDALFISAARVAGPRVAGVILSGALSDGVAGLHAVKRGGGRAIVQHPEQASFPSMPLSALRQVEVDAVLPDHEIAADLVRWARDGHESARRPLPSGRATRRNASPRGRALGHDTGGGHDRAARHEILPVSCPSCGGSLSQTKELGPVQYECHVGHRFNGDSLATLIDEGVEGALWTAVRALQEKALLRRRMHEGASGRTLGRLSQAWLEEAHDAERQAEQIRTLIESVPPPAAVAAAERSAGKARVPARLPRRGGTVKERGRTRSKSQDGR